MTPEARAFLDTLDELCLKNDQTSRQVMAVLTALRSQDGGSHHLKSVTTIAIRRAALPKCAAAADQVDLRVGVGDRHGKMVLLKLEDSADAGRVDLRSLTRDGWSVRRTQRTDADDHFAGHASDAAQALDLRIVK